MITSDTLGWFLILVNLCLLIYVIRKPDGGKMV